MVSYYLTPLFELKSLMGGGVGKAVNLVLFNHKSEASRIETEFISIISGQTSAQKEEMKKFIQL